MGVPRAQNFAAVFQTLGMRVLAEAPWRPATCQKLLRVFCDGLIEVAAISVDGNLEKASQLLDEALVVHARRDHPHYRGITHLNGAYVAQARGRATECLAHANAAIELLSSSSAGSELPSAFVTRAWALLHLGDTNEGERALATA